MPVSQVERCGRSPRAGAVHTWADPSGVQVGPGWLLGFCAVPEVRFAHCGHWWDRGTGGARGCGNGQEAGIEGGVCV